ncbi:type II toxin-antitoxin system VapC family toxin [Sulfitobacter sp. AS92]|uniref:type II toxin-antitoxin system VapC family toxin n=1 Tax=Sulfitobacter sp. AS92 TaxID=3135783 RepID=UPI00316FA983
MARVIINDASCLIDLRKGRLLHVLCRLPVEVIVPLPIRESELLDFTPQEWAMLDGDGLITYDLPPDEVGEAFAIKRAHGRLSANDCFCIVTANHFDEAILLTGDRLLTRVARDRELQVHGILWVTEQLRLLELCDHDFLHTALTLWRNDKSVFVPNRFIDAQLNNLK